TSRARRSTRRRRTASRLSPRRCRDAPRPAALEARELASSQWLLYRKRPPPTIGQRSEPCSDKGRSPMAPAHEARCMCRRGYLAIQRPFDGGCPFDGFHELAPGLFPSIPPGRTDGVALPHLIEREFRGFLRCGLLVFGPLWVRCDDCAFERLVPLSCKGRAAARELMLSSCRCHPNRFRDGAPPPGLRFVGCRSRWLGDSRHNGAGRIAD